MTAFPRISSGSNRPSPQQANLRQNYFRSASRRKFAIFGSAALLTLLFTPILAYALYAQPAGSQSSNNAGGNAASNNGPGPSNINMSESPEPQNTPPAAPNDVNNEHSSSSSLNVNGQDIGVPENGEVHQTVSNSDGSQTQVDVSAQNSSSGTTGGTSRSHQNTHIHVYSHGDESSTNMHLNQSSSSSSTP